jgi:hypothetical protein
LPNIFEIDDPRRAFSCQSAKSHLNASLPHIASDYGGSHWLGTFAMLALDGISGRCT